MEDDFNNRLPNKSYHRQMSESDEIDYESM